MRNKKYLILYFLVIICLILNVFSIFHYITKSSSNKSNNNTIMLKTSLTQTNSISGEGTISNPYQISTEEQLFLFSEMVNQGNTNINAILVNDITINNNVLNIDGKLNDGIYKQWIPIGDINNRYQGIFDGNNHTIAGLYVNDEENCYIGLFGRINQGTIKNVKVIDSYLCGKQSIGGIVGDNTGIVENCSSNCYITGTLEAIGGIAGGNFGTIRNCYNEGKICGSSFVSIETNSSGASYNVTSYCQAIGGITGGNYGTIENCYNISDIKGSSNIGGITGWNNGVINNSYNQGNINCDTLYSYAYGGGIAGYGSILASITDCYNTGDVICEKNYVGGIIGFVEASSKNCITNCYNTGNITGNIYVGGIVGYNQETVKYCYNHGDITGNRYVGGITGYNKAYKKTYGELISCYTIGNVIGKSTMDIGIMVGYNNQGKISNCYYLEGIGNSLSNDNLSICKSLEQFTNGEIAYLLNDTPDKVIYKQTITNDQYPNFTGNKVYYNSEENIYHNHIHKWEYVKEDNKIIAKCNENECTNDYGGCISITKPSSLIYTGSAIHPIISNTTILNDEVIVTYTALNNSKLTDGESINVGEYKVNVTVKDITISLEYSITPLNISNFDINVYELIYNGNYQKPFLTLKNNNKYLTENVDYVVENNKQINVNDNYILQIKGIGNFIGEISKQWEIKPLDITNATVILDKELIYNGEMQTQFVKSVRINDLNVTYEITNNKQINVNDNYILQIKGIGNFIGEISKQWEIKPLDITNATVILDKELIYNGEMQTQLVKSVKINDLDVTYEITNNKQINVNDNYILQIKGTGNYTGEISKQWQILKKDLIITAETQNILYGRKINENAYQCEGLIENHLLQLNLISSTNNITTSGEINIQVNDIIYNFVSVLHNYNIITVSSNLIIEPDLTNINDLNAENVKSSDKEKINQVIQMMSSAEREKASDDDKQKWDNIITICNLLLSEINKIANEINDLTSIINDYDIDKVNSNNISDFEKLIKRIDVLFSSDNITISEKQEINKLKKQIDILQDHINEVVNENERLNNEVLKYKDNVSIIDKEELFNLLQAIEKQLLLSNLTDNEIINLHNNKLIIEEEIKKLELLSNDVFEMINNVLKYDEKTVNINDKEILISLIDDIDILLGNNSLPELEINELNKAKTQVDSLLIVINNVANIINSINCKITEEIIINKDNYDLITSCIIDIDNLLLSSNLTDEERIYFEEKQLKMKEYIKIINDAQNALQSENIQKVANINNQNIKIDNKEDLLKAQDEINFLYNNYINNYTTSEKDLIAEYSNNISISLNIIKNVENIIDDITSLSITTSIKKVNEVKKKYEKLSNHEKDLVDSATENKLSSILKTRIIMIILLIVLIISTLIFLLLCYISKKRIMKNKKFILI